jgi:uncharacterized membrane protein YphA (DoxX/SURF4 family)
MLLDPALAPLSRWTDAVLLAARLIMAVVMLYYGFGTLVLAAEFFGGILMLLGVCVWVAAAAFGFEMLLGTVVKSTKWHKPFTDYSYDLLLLALCLLLLALGPGAYHV